MKTKIFGLCPGKIILAAFLFTISVPAADAQTLTLQLSNQARRVLDEMFSNDTHHGGYTGPLFAAFTNVAGAFDASDTETTPNGNDFVGAHCTALQNSIITATATSLSVTGQVEISSSGTAVENMSGEGSAIWEGLSEVDFSFVIDKPFTYSLQATTTLNTNLLETVPIALVGLGKNSDGTIELPDLAAYGSLTSPGGTIYTAPSASGTSSGVLSAGTYYFVARVHSYSSVDPIHSPASEDFTASFNFTVTYVPQPPDKVAFTPNGTGAFNLVWNAPQPGNYRVLSSTNLIDWVEAIPAAAWPYGLNTNAVNAIPGFNRGFFRVEYLP